MELKILSLCHLNSLIPMQQCNRLPGQEIVTEHSTLELYSELR